MFYLVQQGGSPSFSSFSFVHLGSVGGPANLCDSVANECLPAAECSALQQPSPYCSLKASLRIPMDWLPSSSSPRPPGQEQLSQNWPTCIKLLLLLRQSLSSATSDSSLAPSLSCKDHFIQRWRRLSCVFGFYFLGFTYGFAIVHFYFIIVMKFADIVAVIIDDIDNDCFLMMILWLFNIGLYAVFSFSPAPPTSSKAEAVCSLEVHFSRAARPYTAELSEKSGGWGGLFLE